MIRAYARLVLVMVLAHLAYYNRRDVFKHWIRKDQRANQACTHACCRGMRPHPQHYPAILPDRTLHRASDQDLMTHWDRVQGDSGQDERARAQLLHEMQRRDVAQERREAAEERRRQRWANRAQFRRSERERVYSEAETATTGTC